VEGHCTFPRTVDRCQVHAAAEPAHLAAIGGLGRHMRTFMWPCGQTGCGCMKRHAHGLEWRACQLGPVLGCARRKLRTLHMAEAATGTLKHRAVFQNLGMPLPCSVSPGGFSHASHQKGTVHRPPNRARDAAS